MLDWLETFSRAQNTVKEIMFSAILPTVSVLLGPNMYVKVLHKTKDDLSLKITVRGECSTGKYSKGECSTDKYSKGECSSH